MDDNQIHVYLRSSDSVLCQILTLFFWNSHMSSDMFIIIKLNITWYKRDFVVLTQRSPGIGHFIIACLGRRGSLYPDRNDDWRNPNSFFVILWNTFTRACHTLDFMFILLRKGSKKLFLWNHTIGYKSFLEAF